MSRYVIRSLEPQGWTLGIAVTVTFLNLTNCLTKLMIDSAAVEVAGRDSEDEDTGVGGVS